MKQLLLQWIFVIILSVMLGRFVPFILLSLLTACGASSGGATTSTNDLSEGGQGDGQVTCVVSDCTQASNFETAEYNNQAGLGIIKAAEAYSYLYNINKDYLGDNVIAAVVDTGVYGLHEDLEDNYSESFSVGDSGSDNGYDGDGHGTHVAGIMAASLNDEGMHGVAPAATIVGIAYTGISGVSSGTYSFEDYVIDSNATVVNMSYGSYVQGDDYSKFLEILSQSSVADKMVFVAAAGNERLSTDGTGTYWYEPGDNPVYPAHYATDDIYDALMGQTIAVAAVNTSPYYLDLTFSSNTGRDYLQSYTAEECVGDACMTWYSNFCGETEKYCLAAPGGDANNYMDGNQYGVYSTYVDSDDTSYYDRISGTSMASPHVAGAAAVLQGAWPSLTGEEVVDILLSTATYLDCSAVNLAEDAVCTEGSDEVGMYNNATGRGLLNLEAAVQNIGTSSLYVGNSFSGKSYNLEKTSLSLSPTFGSAISGSKLLKKGVFFDQYNRDYPIDLLDNVKHMKVGYFEVNSYLTNLHSQVRPVNFQIGEGVSLTLTNFNGSESYGQDKPMKRYSVAAVEEDNSDLTGNLTFAQKVNKTNFSMSYLSNDGMAVSEDFVGFLGLTSNMNSFHELSGNDLLNADVIYPLTKRISFFADMDYSFNEEGSNSSIISSGVEFSGFSYRVRFNYGIASYEEEFWGAYGSEAFALGSNNSGEIYEVTIRKSLVRDLNLAINYQYSKVSENNYGGVISGISDLKADSFVMSLNKKMKSKEYGIGFSMPPAIISGAAIISLATARDNDSLTVVSENLDLTSRNRERIYELYYQSNIGKFNYRMNFFLKDNFNHIGGSRDEVMLLSFQRNF